MQDAKFELRPVSEQLYNFIGDRTAHISTAFEPHCEKTGLRDTNQAVQPQKTARGLKFQI